jgi:hypothetical protein
MRRIVVFLVVAAAALTAAAPASAHELPADQRAQVAQIVNAQSGSACDGRISITWSHELDSQRPDVAAKGLEVYGLAYVAEGDCRIAIRSDADGELACTVALHERAHLAGEEHGNGDPLMGDAEGKFGDYRDARCAGVVEITRDDAISAMWQRVSARTKVACKRTSSSTFTCVSSRRMVRKTWAVRGLPAGRISARVVGAVA